MEVTIAIIAAVVLAIALLIIQVFNRTEKALVLKHLDQCASLKACKRLHQEQIDLRLRRLKGFSAGNKELGEALRPQLMPRC